MFVFFHFLSLPFSTLLPSLRFSIFPLSLLHLLFHFSDVPVWTLVAFFHHFTLFLLLPCWLLSFLSHFCPLPPLQPSSLPFRGPPFRVSLSRQNPVGRPARACARSEASLIPPSFPRLPVASRSEVQADWLRELAAGGRRSLPVSIRSGLSPLCVNQLCPVG